MGLQERVGNAFVKLRQRFVQDAFINNEDRTILVNWADLDGGLAAFFPQDRTDFTQYVEGVNARSLANAYILGVVKQGDRLAVRYLAQPETLEMIYAGFSGYRQRVLRFGDNALHHLKPVELKPGITYGGEITYWGLIGHWWSLGSLGTHWGRS